MRSDPVWAPVAAVRAGRVHLSPKMPFGWVDFPPSVNRLIGLWWLAKILYPELFPEDLRALTRDFYRRFYHVTPSDAQIERVLAGGMRPRAALRVSRQRQTVIGNHRPHRA